MIFEIEMKQALFSAVEKEINSHYPTSWGGAAGILTENGEIITSISPEFENAGTSLCMETGAYLEAARRKQNVIATLCLVRETEKDELKVLTPCGICQERLSFFGRDVKCGVTELNHKLKTGEDVEYVGLSDLRPYDWMNAYRR